MKLSKEQQVAHLLNRFGLGATEQEVAEYSALGVRETKRRLIDWDTVPDSIKVPASRFFFYPDGKTTKVAMDPGRSAIWWVFRMLATNRPGREKATLFWHSHFAVSGSKVEFGPMMMDYLDALTDGCNGKFEALLEKVSKTSAMVQWLDTQTSLPGKPNENFAREVMELFTLGIGNYTEKDIQEAAPAFSGWSYRVPFYELGSMDETERARLFYKRGLSPASFQDAPEMHDNGTKTVLGETGPLTAEQILHKLATHPKTAERLARKMWEFYAYPNPEPALVSRLAQRFTRSGGDIKALMFAIADSSEFWSEKSVGTKVKSPVDFAIAALRQVRAGQLLTSKLKPEDTFDMPIHQPTFDTCWSVWHNMSNQGLALLFPPDVSGWQWGDVWATPGAAVERTRMPDIVFAGWRKDDNPSKLFLSEILKPGSKWTEETLVARLLSLYQIQLSPEKIKLLVAACKKHGGVKSLAKEDSASYMFHQVARVVFSTPEYQLC